MPRNRFRQRTDYQERAQLSSRARKGFLEKKKDYKVRAKQFHEKEQQLNKLREKARLRNPNEFYHKMINARLEVTPNSLQISLET